MVVTDLHACPSLKQVCIPVPIGKSKPTGKQVSKL